MNKLITFGVLGLFGLTAWATPAFHPSGPNLTLGASSTGSSVFYSVGNPAAPAARGSEQERRVRFGNLLTFGGYAEIGQVDNFIDDVDDLIKQLDRTNIPQDEGESLVERFNARLPIIGRDGFIRGGASIHVPGLPLIVKGMGGSFVIDANLATQGQLRILDSPLEYVEQDRDLRTNSALYLKGSRLEELSLAYSRPFWSSPNGSLYLGGRLRALRVGLYKTTITLDDANGDSEEVLRDEFDADLTYSVDAGVDLGALWVTPNYSVGAMLRNVNEPSFDYPAVGVNCSAQSGDAQNRCNVALSFADEIDLRETFTMGSQLQLEAALYTQDRHWTLAAAVDANAVRDPVSAEVQWLSISGAYANNNRWIPGFRIGYRQNLAGTELKYVTLGASFLKFFNLDLAYSLDEVVIDNNTVPRSAAINLGFELDLP